MNQRTIRKLVLTGIFVAISGTGLAVSDLARTREREIDFFNRGIAATQSGLIRGKIAGRLVVFKGVSYAAPPIGNLRWQPPQQPSFWAGIRKAQDFAPACPQPFASSTSEDCLYLNIWTPKQRYTHARLPVMVWFHGGGFLGGSADRELYNAEALAKEGAVVVTINYRLGALGFLGHPRLSSESKDNISGNYGLLDQISALRWVRRNIHHFGGNPYRVTIFGESAGGQSVAYLMTAPNAKHLFQRAIAESGFAGGTNRHLRNWLGKLEPLEVMGQRFSSLIGCPASSEELDCLRNKTAGEIVALTFPPKDGIYFAPVTDDHILPDHPGIVFRQGRQARVPLLLGVNKDEAARNPELETIKTKGQYEKYLQSQYGDNWQKVWDFFPANSDSQVKGVLVKLLTVSRMTRWGRRMALDAHESGSPVYFYHFTRVPPFAQSIGAFHELELYYVFGSLIRPPDFDQTDTQLSASIRRYWVQFARFGNPNKFGEKYWPELNGLEEENFLELGDTVQAGSHLFSQESELFEQMEPF